MFDGSRLLSIAEVADVLGVSTASIRQYIQPGWLKHIRVGHPVHLRESDIITFVDPATVTDRRKKGPGETVLNALPQPSDDVRDNTGDNITDIHVASSSVMEGTPHRG